MGKYKEAFVYKWTNLSNGHYYIGYHKGDKDDGYVCSSKSERFWIDYKNPENKWERIILFEGSHNDCVKEELRLLNELDLTNESVYNNSKGGGIIFSEEVRKKMSLNKIGKKRKPITEETRKRMSDAKIGKVYSQEARKNMSDAKKGTIPWNRGIPQTEEVKNKLKISCQLKPRKHLKFFIYALENHIELFTIIQIDILKMYTNGIIISEIAEKHNMKNYDIKNTLRSIKNKSIKKKYNALSYFQQKITTL